MQCVMAAIPAYSPCQSLCLWSDRRSHLLQFDHKTPPFFLDLLAETLYGACTPGVALLPLECLSLVLKSPPRWLVGFETAFARLAAALVGACR